MFLGHKRDANCKLPLDSLQKGRALPTERNRCWGRCLVWREGNCGATLHPLSAVLEQGELGAETTDQATFDRWSSGTGQRPQLRTANTRGAGSAIAKCKTRVRCVDLMLNTSVVLLPSKPCSATDLNSSKATGFLSPAHWPRDFLPWFFFAKWWEQCFPAFLAAMQEKWWSWGLEGTSDYRKCHILNWNRLKN